jgi:pSer/pThr/pTyr-binding forkhead associated (FHA) protein
VTAPITKSEAQTIDPASAVQSGKPSAPLLAFVHPSASRHAIPAPELNVGRSGECGLQLPGGRVSRAHCVFRTIGGKVLVNDLGSRNGTFVNGVLAAHTELSVGDVVRIGDWVGLFERGEVTDGNGMAEVAPDVWAGSSMRRVLAIAEAVAPTKLSIILHGETGAGKERVAQYIHQKSGRTGPFQALNCAAIPEALAEAELFGHQRGAFTGADRTRPGLFRSAHGGTLLLDEISDLPPSIQTKLLRVLESEHVTPLGTAESVPVDVRVIVAGQKALWDLVVAGQFRGDLFARLNGLALDVPPLRERKDEIISHFLRSFHRFSGAAAPALSPELVEALLLYPWPFNVREVVQMAHRLAALHGKKSERGPPPGRRQPGAGRGAATGARAVRRQREPRGDSPRDFSGPRVPLARTRQGRGSAPRALMRFVGTFSRFGFY